MAESPEARKHYRCKHETLGLDLPIVITLAEHQYLLSNVHDALRVVLRDVVENIQRIHAHIGLWVGEADEGVVQEHIEPLLVELFLLSDEVGLARIDDLIIGDIVLEVLDDFDSLVQVVMGVTVDQFAHVLPLIRALLDDLAVVLEEVIDEELVELI